MLEHRPGDAQGIHAGTVSPANPLVKHLFYNINICLHPLVFLMPLFMILKPCFVCITLPSAG
jgi:hypothetical protein